MLLSLGGDDKTFLTSADNREQWHVTSVEERRIFQSEQFTIQGRTLCVSDWGQKCNQMSK